MGETRDLSNEGRQNWMETVKNEFKKGRFAGHVVFSLLLVVLEKLVELDFECPCKANLNAPFAALFFITPGIFAFVLMSTVHPVKCSCDKANARNVLHCIVPAIVWLILLLFDGCYIACAMTDWSGRYVIADKAAPVKWCEPNSTLSNSTLSTERLMKSEGWYFYSQFAGLGLLGFMAMVILRFNCTKQRNPDVSTQRSHSNTPMELRVE